MKKVVLFLIFVISLARASAQDFSNKGKDFWVGYGYHQIMTTINQQQMVLYFATDQPTTINITIPGVGYSETIVAGPGATISTSAPIPKIGTQDVRLLSESVTGENKGIHITSDKPMVAYAHIYNASVSGATILFPTSTLGKEYYSINYNNVSNAVNSNCFFYAIATDTGTTTIEITPSAATLTHPANVPFTVNLTQGQVYNVMGQVFGNNGVDLTGSKIRSIPSGTGGCKKIAVFSGSGRISITCNGSSASSDNYMVQAFPQSAWGKSFLTSPTGGSMPRNIFRVCVSNPAAVVNVNGAPTTATLINNFYYDLPIGDQPLKITSASPITVAQYITSQNNCGNGTPGDPEVIYLSPIEQNINKVIWYASPAFLITSHYFNVIIPNTGTALSSFTLDGVPVGAAAFTQHPQDPNFSYLTQPVASGSRSMQSDSGFNAIAYGYGNFESYGYNAGTNVRDLYQQISTATEFGIETVPSICTGTPFKFKISLTYKPDSLFWNFLGATNAPGPPLVNVTQKFPVADSITVINGRTVYWYSLPSFYTFNNVGVYPVRITAFSPPTAASCGTVQDIDFDLTVSAPPVVTFTNTTARCVAETVQFTDGTTSAKPVYKWYWNFGDPSTGANNISLLKNPTHLFSAPGSYNVRFSSITTAGCVGDTITRTIVIAPLPSATVGPSVTVCQNASAPTLTFTGTGGSQPYIFTYNINGGAPQTITTTGNLSTATVTVPTNTVGVFQYNITNVQNVGSTLCTTPLTGVFATVTVSPLPTATIAGATSVCQNTPSPLITFTGANGIAPYTFTYSINGGAPLTVTTTTGNSFSVPVPTNIAQTLVYNLTAVSVGGASACSQTVSNVSATVIVSPAASATINGNAAVCQNATSPLVTFTGSNGISPYTFTYNINGGGSQTISSGSGNTASVNVPTAIAGTFVYNLVGVQDGSAQNCLGGASTGSVTVVINSGPTATLTGSAGVCLNATSPVITFSGANGIAPYIFNYTINGVAQTALTSVGNSVTLNAPTSTAGTFNYQLTSVRESSASTCVQNQNGTISITVQSLPAASIMSSAASCQNASPATVTFTGSGGSVPYSFTYQVNGGAAQTITTTGVSPSVSLTVPTAVTGSFVYKILSVQEGSSLLCSQTFTNGPSTTVVVNPLPAATISGGASACVGASSPFVTFTGANGTAPYTFTYSINGVTQPGIVSTGASATVSAPTAVAGNFLYQLVNVRDASATACTQSQTGSTSVIIYPQPTPDFTFSTTACASTSVSFNSATSTPGAGNVNSWLWSFGDPASGSANASTLQNPGHVFAAAGSYTVSLTISTDNGCKSAIFTRTVIVNAVPKVGFILPKVCLLDPFAQFIDTSRIAAPATITGWLWNFGDPASGAANTSTIQNATHVYSAVGNYNVQLIAISNNGCRDTLSNQILTISGGNPQADFIPLNAAANCANDSVSIQNKSTIASGNITRLEIFWDNTGQPAVFDFDDVPAFNKVYKHKYPAFQSPLTKSYNVRVRSYSGGVCFSDKIVAVTVNASPKVQFASVPNVCYDAVPFQILQAREIGGVPGNGIFTGPGVSPSGVFTPTLITTLGVPVTIKYVFTSTTGGCKDSASQTIVVLDTASSKFRVQSPVCDRTAASFTDESVAPAGGTLLNTTWNFGDGTAPQTYLPGAIITHLFPGAGTYTVTMNANTVAGCRAKSTSRQVVISPIPRPNFTLDKTSYCLPNATVVFNSSLSSIADGSENAFTYAWNFGDPASGSSNASVARNPTHVYSTVGNYPVRLSITSNAGCVKDTIITITTIHPAPIARFSTLPAVGACVGADVIFRDESNGADGTLQRWNWNFGDNSGTSTQQNPAPYKYLTSGTFPVKLTVTNSFGCVGDTTKMFTVFPFPSVNAGEDRFVLQGGSVTLDPTVSGNGLQYLWTWDVSVSGGYLSSATIKNPVSSPLSDVTYTLTVTNDGGCIASDVVFVKLLESPNIPNTFSPNNDGINDFWIIKYLDSYPNSRVQVFTRTGASVFESRGYTKPWNGTRNGQSLPVDTYYYIVEPGNGLKPVTGYVTIVK